MKKVKMIREVVFSCLRDDVSARNSDWKLYESVCNRLGLATDKITIQDIANNPSDFPTFETITRCRRKAQEKGLFKACDKVQEFRTQQYFEFKEAMND